MDGICRFRFAMDAECRITPVCSSQAAAGPGLVRSRVRARRVRRGVRRAREGVRSHAHRRAGAAGADQPAAPRRVRLRGEHRRRRRHPHPDARPFLAAGVAPLGFDASRRAAIRRRLRLPAARSGAARRRSRQMFEAIVAEEGQRVLGWRDVPTDDAALGAERGRGRAASSASSSSAAAPAPTRRDDGRDCAFERKLYVIRKRIEHAVDALPTAGPQRASTPEPVVADAHLQGDADGEPDPADVPGPARIRSSSRRSRSCTSASARTRSRRGRWRIPYRFIAHNGEINTLRGNINWMKRARSAARDRRARRGSEEDPADHPRGRAATPRPSTTCSNSSSWRGARCRTPS